MQFSTDDLRTPESLERILRQFQHAIQSNRPVAAPAMPSISSLVNQLAPLLRDQLQSTGDFPLNLQSLLPSGIASTVGTGTHSDRLTLYTPPLSMGNAFYETDRSVVYVASGTPLAWHYTGGTYTAALGSIPADLSTNDIGFRFTSISADQETDYVWTGTEFVTTGGYLQEITDAVTAAITTLVIQRHLSTGTAGVGFGAGEVVQLENGSNAAVTALYRTVTWTNATSAAEAADYALSLVVGGALTQAWKLTSAAAVQMRGKFTLYNNAAPTDGQLLIGNTGTSSLDAATLTPGTGITINNAAGAITIGLSGTFDADIIALTAQSTAIGSTNFTNGGTGSTFRVNYYLEDTTADITAGTIQLTVSFTDDAGATTVSSAALALTAVGRTSGIFFVRRASGNVAYSTTLVGIIGTARYALYIGFEKMS